MRGFSYKTVVNELKQAQGIDRLIVLVNMLLYACLGWLYFRGILAMFVGATVSLLTIGGVKNRRLASQQKKTYIQFREFLQSVSSSVGTGNSFESALKRAPGELSFIWADQKGVFMREIRSMSAKMDVNYDITRALDEFCEAIDIEEGKQFVQTYKICRSTGGNLVQAMQSCITIISDKLLTLQEIEHVLSQRKMEQRLLMIMPHVFMFFLSVTAADFVAPLFSTFVGRVGVAVSLLLSSAATIISNRIVKIDV